MVAAKHEVVVTVILPVYDEKPEFLERAIESISRQTMRDFELLVVNDGSSNPSTLEMLAVCASREPRLRLKNFEHEGLTKTLNKGLALAQGEFICRQDSDDWSAPQRLSIQVECLRKRPDIAMVGSAIMLHRENGETLWPIEYPLDSSAILLAFESGNPFCHGATAFRKSAALELGGYREEFACSQDYDLFWRMCERFGAANCSEILYHLRRTRGGVSASKTRDQMRAALIIKSLASMRRTNKTENVDLAVAEADRSMAGAQIPMQAALRQSDELLLAGYPGNALLGYLSAAKMYPSSHTAILKLMRLFVFLAVPPILRSRLFQRS